MVTKNEAKANEVRYALPTMILSEEKDQNQYKIQAYEPGVLTISDQRYHSSLILSADKLIENWQVTSAAALGPEDATLILTCKPAIVLLGTGQSFIIPPTSFLDAIRTKGIGIEFMDTRAACHTFIVLTAEGRNVVAALLL